MNQIVPFKLLPQHQLGLDNDEQAFLTDLASSLNATARLLKQTHGDRFFSKAHLYHKTWSLVIGPPNAGKTTLLQASETNHSQVQASFTQTCGTWAFEHSVYIEVPGKFIVDKRALSHWPSIIKTIKNIRKRKPLDSIILTLNLYDFVQQSHQARKTLCHNFIRIIKNIAQDIKEPLPLYVIFTHADCIAGFTDFFAEMTEPQRQKILGITIPKDTKRNGLQRTFDKTFTQLLQRLNELLIPTLHRTKNAEKRSRIKEFPLQIESMRSLFSYILQHVIKLNERKLQCHFRGFFFTTSAQHGTAFDCLASPIENHYALELAKNYQQERQTKPYFIHELLHRLIPTESKNIKNQDQSYRKKELTIYGSLYTAASVAAIGCVLFLFQHFKETASTIQRINTNLQSFNRLQQNSEHANPDSYQLISSINLLANLKDDAEKVNENWPISFPYPYLKNLKTHIDQLFSSSMQTQFLPNLAAEIENSLSNLATNNPAELYSTLKAYIMLGNPNRMQTEYFTQWIKNHWQKNPQLQMTTLERNLSILNQILQKPLQPLSLNSQIIKEARQKLAELPKARLVYLILKDQAKMLTEDSDNTGNTHAVSDVLTAPEIFTLDEFQNTYQNKIQQSCQTLLEGNWILGKPSGISNTDKNALSKLITEVQELYVDDYTQWWQQSIRGTHITEFKSLTEAIQTLSDFRHRYFTSDTWLQRAKANTKPLPENKPLAKIFNSKIANRFIGLHELKTSDLNKAQQSLHDLENYLEKVTLTKNPDKAVFTLTKHRFTQPEETNPLSKVYETAEQLPEPIKPWLTNLADQSWSLLLRQTENYINEQWQILIWPNYEDSIAERFPLQKEAEQEISIKEFSKFFSPQGTLSQFFVNFVKPFLETSQSSWSPKQINGQGLTMSTEVIQNFERANIIRLMFFGKENTSPKAKFYLKPVVINPDINHLILTINHQKMFDYYGSTKKSQFSWDGNQTNPSSSFEFQNNQGKTFRISESGAWGWIKLLNKFNLKTNEDTRQYTIHFTLDGKEAAKYLLIADNVINPLIPSILENFELKEEICKTTEASNHLDADAITQ